MCNAAPPGYPKMNFTPSSLRALSNNSPPEYFIYIKIEAVLYLKGRSISKKDLAEITNSDINSITNSLSELKVKYSDPKSAIHLNETPHPPTKAAMSRECLNERNRNKNTTGCNSNNTIR